jgi:uncharacterized repeat protein (TIGR03803 family)
MERVALVHALLASPRVNRRSSSVGWLIKLSLLAILATTSQAQTFRTLFSFQGAGGSRPEYVRLVQGTDGNFYGTTSDGGANGTGTVFRMTAAGGAHALYSFCSKPNCTDGSTPFAGLIQGSDGNFYGTTYVGGAHDNGTVFKITSRGVLTVLHSFDSTDGAHPSSTLIQATDGDFYGTTTIGGATNSGTVFKMTSSGTLSTLYSFCAQPTCTDGLYPIAGVIQAFDGNFYGTTGGSDTQIGTVFKLSPAGVLTTLYEFCPVLQTDCDTGSYPAGGVVQGSDGNFYGTTYYGGPNGFGTVFQLPPTGPLTTLHTFLQTDGENPIAGLIQGSDGNFYGTTIIGGLTDSGTLFSISPAGVLTDLHDLFCESLNCPDGANPYGGLAQGTDGTFYGTTFAGNGTVFNLATGLGQFVETQPTSGQPGTKVKILGSDLVGATQVTFNGKVAQFTVLSASEITTTVPTGATTGKVRVELPGSTLVGNVAFRVP